MQRSKRWQQFVSCKPPRNSIGLGTQALEALREEIKHTGTKAHQHHRDACHDSPKRDERCAAIITPPHDDVAWYCDQKFENTSGEEPSCHSFNKAIRTVRVCKMPKHDRPKNPGCG